MARSIVFPQPRSNNNAHRLANSAAGWALVLCWSLPATLLVAQTPSPLPAGSTTIAAEIDSRLQAHWQRRQLQPAPLGSDSEFIRRLALDLLGRAPTHAEWKAFVADTAADKRPRLVERWLAAPEFPLHWGAVLDGIVQDRYAGEGEFLEFMRQSRRDHVGWDDTFRRILLGPWESDRDRRAAGFLRKRIRNLDELTNDTAKVFFGVNVGCAKCHDHPLVPDWKQHHYYGMQAFLSRTYEDKKLKQLAEKNSGEVQFVDVAGKSHTAQFMFLSGEVADIGTAKTSAAGDQEKFSPREALVHLALEQKSFFSQAAVNYVWANLLGRGLVEPLDQLHSGNSEAVPGLLAWLADDFAAHDYNLDRLIAGMVLSSAYQRSSVWNSTEPPPAAEHFALANVRPLTPRQFMVSLLLATGDESFASQLSPAAREQAYRALESQAAKFTPSLDAAGPTYQASVSEALFMTNHADVYATTAPRDGNLAARMLALNEPEAMVKLAVETILSRAPRPEELGRLTSFLKASPAAESAVRDLIWALLTSGEFRFSG